MVTKYRDNMTPEETKKLLQECEAEERAYADAGDMSQRSEEDAHAQELERGYAMDRISRK